MAAERIAGQHHAADNESGDVHPAGQEKQGAGALDDAPSRHSGLAQQPAADRESSKAAGGQQRARRLLGPGELAGQTSGHSREEETEDHHIGGTRGDLEDQGRGDPAEAHTRYLVDYSAQRGHSQEESDGRGRNHERTREPPPQTA